MAKDHSNYIPRLLTKYNEVVHKYLSERLGISNAMRALTETTSAYLYEMQRPGHSPVANTLIILGPSSAAFLRNPSSLFQRSSGELNLGGVMFQLQAI